MIFCSAVQYIQYADVHHPLYCLYLWISLVYTYCCDLCSEIQLCVNLYSFFMITLEA